MDYFIGFLVLLGALISVHEFGHFIVAKAVGVKVLKFSLGFPPAMIKRQWGETEYTLSWIPLGGYVKLLGEDSDSETEVPPEEAHRAYPNQSILSRMAIIFAGPLFNYLFAVFMLTAGYLSGLPVLSSQIGTVLDKSPAMEAGLKPGDQIVAINGQKVWRWDDMRQLIEESPGKPLTITVQRGEEQKEIRITPSRSEHPGPLGEPVGRIGVAPSGKSMRLGPASSVYEGCHLAGQLTKLVAITLVKLVRGEISAAALSGPITIAQASGESLKAGPVSFIFLLSYISINLAIINLLPIPVLDGGHLLFLVIEAVIGHPVTGKVREMAVQAGLLLIVFLMVLVFYNDIHRILTQGWSLPLQP